MNVKGIPYRTVWVECCDIKSHCISIGAKPTAYEVNPVDGSKTPLYTFPVIQDPATGAIVSDSYNIALYLDKTYPSSNVTLIPAGTQALQAAFQDVLAEKIAGNIMPLMILDIKKQITNKSYDWWCRTREENFGKPVEDLVPAEQRPAMWKKGMEGFKQVGDWLDMDGGRQFLMGDKLSWGDIQLGVWLLAIRILWGENNREWKELMGVDGGRWKKFFEVIERWAYVDEEGIAAWAAL